MNKRLRELITTLIGLSIEGLLMAAGSLWFLGSQNVTSIMMYFELPCLLIVMGILAWMNIQEYFHPEDESLQR